MAALMVFNYDTIDREALEAYRAEARPLLVGPGLGEMVAMSDATVDLGEGATPGSDTVIIRFPSLDAAQAVYRSGEYQRVLADRLKATRPTIAFIVETVD